MESIAEEQLSIIIALVASSLITLTAMPYFINRLRTAGVVGRDVNKPEKPEVPEMGGLVSVVGFSLALLIVLEFKRNFSSKENGLEMIVVFSGVIGAFGIAAMIGIIDDLLGMRQRKKAVYMLLASLPLIIIRAGREEIFVPFLTISFESVWWLYWFILVPLGITGVANALNMSAGYNGLESGQVLIISFFLFLISFNSDPSGIAVIIFSALIGTSFILFLYNRYPAKIFLGDVGTLGLGTAIGVGVIVGSIEFYGIICIIPAFYELFSTLYYRKKKVDRRKACMSPVILSDGKLRPPEGAERFTLAYFLLSKKPMSERILVNTILSLYAICGVIALALSMAFT